MNSSKMQCKAKMRSKVQYMNNMKNGKQKWMKNEKRKNNNKMRKIKIN